MKRKKTPLICVIGLLCIFAMQIGQKMYLHSMIQLYAIFCVALNNSFYEENLQKEKVPVMVFWTGVEIVIGILLGIAGYKKEGTLFLIAPLLVLVYFSMRFVIRIVRLLKNEK